MENLAIKGNTPRSTEGLVALTRRLTEQRLAQLSPEQRSKVELGKMLSKTSASTKDPAASGD